MKLMGIDYGLKRIGVAVSDERGVLAFPKIIILNDFNIFKKLSDLIKSYDIGEIVVGESLDLAGQANPLEARIEIFIQELQERYKIPVRKQKEFLTSVEARKSKESKKSSHQSQVHSKQKSKKQDKVDAGAAALILQRYLDKMNQSRSRE
ncbi:MAG: Holliday junction resolvase RuvX [bacterium]|nr:Holliday junction resolvase RuvX [bacterium]